MKFHTLYEITLQEEIEATSLEEAREIANHRRKDLAKQHSDVICREVIPISRISFSEEDSSPPTLLLDGSPIEENQILYLKYSSKAETICGRVKKRADGWLFSAQEFVGHPYLDIPLNRSFIKNAIVVGVVDRP